MKFSVIFIAAFAIQCSIAAPQRRGNGRGGGAGSGGGADSVGDGDTGAAASGAASDSAASDAAGGGGGGGAKTAIVYEDTTGCPTCTEPLAKFLTNAGYSVKTGKVPEIIAAMEADPQILVAYPGGGEQTGDYADEWSDGAAQLKTFVENGGKYLGVCSGAYLAGSYYFDLVPFGIESFRGAESTEIGYELNGQDYTAFFQNGPSLEDVKEAGSNAKIYGVMEGGYPAAVMIGDNIGLISLHWEFTRKDYAQEHFNGFMAMFGGGGGSTASSGGSTGST